MSSTSLKDIDQCTKIIHIFYTVSSVQLLSRVQLFTSPRTAAHQASLSITISRSSLKLMSIESVMPSSHLILCRPLFLLPPIPPSFGIVNKTEIDVFLELSCFFHDPADVGHLISGSSAFSKTSLNIYCIGPLIKNYKMYVNM